MFTRKRFQAPPKTGDGGKDFDAFARSISEHLRYLEDPGALEVTEATLNSSPVGEDDPSTGKFTTLEVTTSSVFPTSNTTPTPSSFGGTITTVSGAVRAQRVGDRASYTVTVTITTNGTGSGFIQVTMPFSAAETTPTHGVNATSPVALTGFISGTTLRIYKYDGTYPGADNTTLVMSGSYRV